MNSHVFTLSWHTMASMVVHVHNIISLLIERLTIGQIILCEYAEMSDTLSSPLGLSRNLQRRVRKSIFQKARRKYLRSILAEEDLYCIREEGSKARANSRSKLSAEHVSVNRQHNTTARQEARSKLSADHASVNRQHDTAARQDARSKLPAECDAAIRQFDTAAREAARNHEKQDHLNHIRVNDFNISASELATKLEECTRKDHAVYLDSRTNHHIDGDGSGGEESGDDRRNDDHPREGLKSTYDGKGDSFFDDLVKSPAKAVLLFYLNSGLFRFGQYKDYSSCWNDKEVDQDALMKEIEDERLTDEEYMKLLTSFLVEHSYTTGNLLSCGACGIRLLERMGTIPIRYKQLLLQDEDAQVLAYTTEETNDFDRMKADPACTVTIPIDDDWNTRTVEIWKAKSVYCWEGSGSYSYWHLHPELVGRDDQGRPCTMVCPICQDKLARKERPKLSIANGIDFGFYRRLQLTLPNLHEQLILDRSRLFFATMKVSSNIYGVVDNDLKSRFKCHAILIPHDAPEVASYMFNTDLFGPNGMLDLESLKGLLQVYFLDPKGNPDGLARRVFGTTTIMSRAWVLAQWLLVSKWLHPYYKDLDVSRIRETSTVVDHLNDHIEQTTITETNPDTIRFEQRLGSDVAQVQHMEIFDSAESARRSEAPEEVPEPPTVRFSYVTRTEQAYLAQDKNDYRLKALETFADMNSAEFAAVKPDEMGHIFFDIKAIDDYLHRFPANLCGGSLREKDPLNDYSSDDRGVSTSFPHVFMLGKAYGRPIGRLTHEERFHLLNQFTLVPATDRRLLGFLFDIMQRMRVIDGVKAYVEGNNWALQVVQQILEDPMERQLLQEAVRFPHTEAARQLLHKYMVHLRFAGKDVAYGAVEGLKLKHRLLGSCNRYSAGNYFFTISPTNLDNPRSIRLCFRTTDNASFPSKFEDNCSHGRNGVDFMDHMNETRILSEGHITLPKSVRARFAMTNPVAFVMENRMLFYDILHILFGLPPEDKGFFSKIEGRSSRRTRYFKLHKGLMGHNLFNTGVIEGHARGTVHGHFTGSAGLSPYVLERYANLDPVCERISQVLDTIYSSTAPRSIHVAKMVQNLLRKKRSLWQIPDTVGDATTSEEVLLSRANLFGRLERGEEGLWTREMIESEVQPQTGIRQIHQHLVACHEGLSGIMGCRFDMSMALCCMTMPVRLIPKVPSGTEGNNPANMESDDEISESDNLSVNLEEVMEAQTETGEEDQEAGGDQGSEDEEQTSEEEEETVLDDPHPCSYKVVQLVGNPTTEDDTKHHLYSILDLDKDQGIVIWETKRPLIDAGSFGIQLSETADQKQHILQSFHTILDSVQPYDKPTSAFWQWFEKDATLEQQAEMYETVQRKLPLANGFVAAFNPGISFATGSHNNICLLGSLAQAKSAMFYLIPYQGKNKYPLEESLSILEHALNHIHRFKSKARDKGTIQRTVKHLLTRVLNQMHLHMEISDWQVAGALLDLPSMFMSDLFSYGNPLAMASLHTQMEMDEDRADAFHRLCNEIAEIRERTARQEQGDATRTNNVDPQNHLTPGNLQGFDPNPTNSGMDTNNQGIPVPSLVTDPVPVPVVGPINAGGAAPAMVPGDMGDFIVDDAGSGVPAQGDPVPNETRPYQQDAVAQDFGYIIKLKLGPTEARKIELIPATSTFYFRGKALQEMNYYEYLACVDFINQPPSPKRDNPLNFKAQTQFKTHPSFMGYFDSYHVVRRKQHTPLLTGKIPPHPGDAPPLEAAASLRDQWTKKADAFARYYLTLFRPESMDDSLLYTWEALCDWIQVLQDDNSVISTFRLMMMRQHIRGTKSLPVQKKMAREYRGRARKLWKTADKAYYARELALKRRRQNQNRRCGTNEELQEGIYKPLKKRARNNLQVLLQHDEQQARQIATLFAASNSAFVGDRKGGLNHHHHGRPDRFMCKRSSRNIQLRVEDIRNWRGPPETNKKKKKRRKKKVPGTLSGIQACTGFIQRQQNLEQIRTRIDTDPGDPNSQQIQLLDVYQNYLLGGQQIPGTIVPPQIVLLHGGPGVGKTTLRDAILDSATICARFNLKTAFNAVNAAEMGGRTTATYISIHAHSQMHEIGQYKAQIIADLRQVGFQLDSFVAVEECSTQAPWHLARFSRMCQCSNGNVDPFGGCMTLLIGDLTQLGPVMAGPTLTQAVMDINLSNDLRTRLSQRKTKIPLGDSVLPAERPNDAKYNADHPYTVGARLLTTAKWFELTKQNRSKDPRHTVTVRQLYTGQPVSFQDLKDRNYKIFSHLDAGQEEWIRAPVLCAINRARHTLKHVRAKHFATFYQDVVIRWQCNYSDWENKPSPAFMNDVLQDPLFYDYFVYDSDGFFTESYQRSLDLVNGIAIRYHSIKFDEDDEEFVSEIIRRTPVGGVVTVPNPPIAINVQVFLPSTTSDVIRDALLDLSLDTLPRNHQGPTRIIIPVYKTCCKYSNNSIPVYGGPGFGPARVKVQSLFPIEPALAITVHKSEGRTMKRIIVALSHNPGQNCDFSHQQLHVSMSRVQQGEHIRLLLTGDSEAEQWHSLAYLEKLKPDPSIEYYFGGFRSIQDAVDPNRGWHLNTWSRDRANAVYRAKLDKEDNG